MALQSLLHTKVALDLYLGLFQKRSNLPLLGTETSFGTSMAWGTLQSLALHHATTLEAPNGGTVIAAYQSCF